MLIVGVICWSMQSAKTPTTNAPVKCWICGNPGMTGEHKTKKSDLRAVFGTPTQADPLYYHDGKRKNRPVGSLDAKILKSPGRICGECNSARTQPHDRAWERMSESLRTRRPAIGPGDVVRANRIFPYDTAQQMRSVHLYFVKLFGCHILEGPIPIDVTLFAKAILTGKPHPNVYLKFGCGPLLGGQAIAGMSDVHTALRTDDGSCTFATWFYNAGSLAVNVMFAMDGEKREGLVGAWHPRFGTSKLKIADF